MQRVGFGVANRRVQRIFNIIIVLANLSNEIINVALQVMVEIWRHERVVCKSGNKEKLGDLGKSG